MPAATKQCLSDLRLSACISFTHKLRPLIMNIATFAVTGCQEKADSGRALVRAISVARRRSIMTQPLPNRVCSQHKWTAVMYVYHALIAGRGDDNEAFPPVLPIEGRLSDGRKKQRLPVTVVNEVGLFSGSTFLPLKPAVCRHDGTPVNP